MKHRVDMKLVEPHDDGNEQQLASIGLPIDLDSEQRVSQIAQAAAGMMTLYQVGPESISGSKHGIPLDGVKQFIHMLEVGQLELVAVSKFSSPENSNDESILIQFRNPNN